MTNEQKLTIQHSLTWATTRIQEIESSSENVHEKRKQIDWQLLLLLDDVVEALPQALREQAQACLKARDRMSKAIWDESEAFLAKQRTQKEASPHSLTTTDS